MPFIDRLEPLDHPMKGEPMARPFVRVLFVSTPSLFPKWAWWVRVFAGSPFVHVAATSHIEGPEGPTEIVMNATHKRVLFWRYQFWTEHPSRFGFVWSIKVPARRWPDLNRYDDPAPKSKWRIALRWADPELYPYEDCVTKVCRMLTEAGVYVPDNVVTPGDLFDFLRGEGHDLCCTDSNTSMTPLSGS